MSERNDITGEIWKPIPSTNGLYEASSLGRIRSAKKLIVLESGEVIATVPAFIVKQGPNKATGYPTVAVRNAVGRVCGGFRSLGGNKQYTRSVHQLVAEAFIGPRPGRHDVHHKDGDRQNNRPENLEYVTRSRNISDSYERGRAPASVLGRTYRILTNEQVAEIKARYASGGVTQLALAREYGVCDTHVCQIVNGKRRS